MPPRPRGRTPAARLPQRSAADERTCREAHCASRRGDGLVSPPRLGGERCCQSSQQARCHRSTTLATLLQCIRQQPLRGCSIARIGRLSTGLSQWGARRGTRRDHSDRDSVGRARAGRRRRAPIDGIPLFHTAREAEHVHSFVRPIHRGWPASFAGFSFSCLVTCCHRLGKLLVQRLKWMRSHSMRYWLTGWPSTSE